MTGHNGSAEAGRTVAPADCRPDASQTVGRHWWEYFTDRRKPVVPPSSTSWTAACPQCRRDADWHSEASQSVIRYTLDCRVCGVTRWGGAV